MSLDDPSAPVRLVHFSDIHVTTRPLGWRRGDYFTKRLAAWVNLYGLGRAYRFRHAEKVLATLREEMRRSPPDRVLFTGDATALGFEAEVARAAELLGLHNGHPLPGLAVPGNHDYHVRAAAMSGAFERHFAPWQEGERVDGATYPFAQRVGSVWLVAVNSSVANRWFWDARGFVDEPQLERLERLLAQLSKGYRILVTHYPVCLSGGEPEARHHGLRNLDRLVDLARRGGISLWLHGHRHVAYHHTQTAWTSFPVICSGSATQAGKWSYGEYTLRADRLTGVRKVYDAPADRFRQADAFEMSLRLL